MAFFHPSPASVARTRRTKDSSKSSTSHSSSRRTKEASKTREEGKSSAASSAYETQSSASSHVPETSHSEDGSSPLASSIHSFHSLADSSASMYQLSIQPETPAALQQYLDPDSDTELTIEARDLSGSEPSLQTARSTKTKRSRPLSMGYEDTKVVRSEAPDLPGDKTPHSREQALDQSTTPTSPQSSMLQVAQSESNCERAFTPPLPPLAATSSYSPPPYMSPIPVRGYPPTQHLLTYQTPVGYPLNHGGMPYMDNYARTHVPNQYYLDYNARAQQPPSESLHRTLSQNTASSSHRKSRRRSGGQVPPEEDVMSIVHRINSILPDFRVLLDRYEDASKNLLTDSQPVQTGEPSIKDILREKDDQIERLQQELAMVKQTADKEKQELRNELSQTRMAQHELELSLLSQTKSCENLREKSELLQASHDEMLIRSKECALVYEFLRTRLVKEADVQERPHRAENRSMAAATQTVQQAKAEEHTQEDRPVPGQYTISRTSSPTLADVIGPVIASDPSTSSSRESRAPTAKELLEWQNWQSEILTVQEHGTRLREASQRTYEAQAKQWEEELGRLKTQWQTHRETVMEQHEQEKTDLQDLLETTQARYAKRCEDLEADNRDLHLRIEQLRAHFASERSSWTQSAFEFKEAAARIDLENRHLAGLLHACEFPIAPSGSASAAATAAAAGDFTAGNMTMVHREEYTRQIL